MTTQHKTTKKKIRVKRKLHDSRRIIFFSLLFLVLILCISGLAGFFLSNYSYQRMVAVESEPPDMTRIPLDVRRTMRYASPSATFRVPVLMYHYIEYVTDKGDTIRQSLNVSPSIFEQQLQTLKNAGYTFLTAKEMGDVLDGKSKLPQKPILLTFDDGHRDFYTDVLPLLQKYKVKATEYIIPGFTGGSDFMTQEQLQEVIRSGLVEIGAHTVHHIALKNKPFPLVVDEVFESKKMLEDLYHIHVVSFAYPSGFFDQQAIDIVKSAGFKTAMSTIPGEDINQTNRFFIYRLRPGYRSGETLLSYLLTNPWTPKQR